jgi:hypothetical protein
MMDVYFIYCSFISVELNCWAGRIGLESKFDQDINNMVDDDAQFGIEMLTDKKPMFKRFGNKLKEISSAG